MLSGVRLMPASRSARRTEPKNHVLSRTSGPPSPPSNCRTIAVVGVPPAAVVPGWQPALGVHVSTLLPLKPFGCSA